MAAPGQGRAGWLERLGQAATTWAGSSWAFVLALTVVLGWLVSGPFFGYSDTWQLVINTGTTIVTFLMVFLIQRSQNKDGLAIQLKLNELIAALRGASNRLIDIEDLSEEEVGQLREQFRNLVRQARADQDPAVHHSVEEAADKKRPPRNKKGSRNGR